MSEWQVRVIKISNIEKHPNADTLSITNIDGGYPCILRTGDFQIGDLAVYAPIDSIFPNDPEFDFLGDHRRIKAKRLRGIFSMGVLIKPRAGMKEGDIVDKQFNITKYEPEIEAIGKGKGGKIVCGDNAKDPGFIPVYTDIEGYRKYKNLFIEGEEVVLTEKIHGTNARFLYHQNKLWVGSHTKIKKNPWDVESLSFLEKAFMILANVIWFIRTKIKVNLPNKLFNFCSTYRSRDVKNNEWSIIAKQYNLMEKLKSHPGIVIYGEIYGQVQDLKYGSSPNQFFLRLFDALDINTRKYLDYDDFIKLAADLDIPTVPILYRGEWKKELEELRNGKTTLGGNHCREGFVVKPAKEEIVPHLGRKILKFVGEDYLLRKTA